MLRFISRAFGFWRRAASSAAEREDRQSLLEGDIILKTVQGVVTKFCNDYGYIDELIYFSRDAVTGGVVLKVGQRVSAIVEEDTISHELKAIKVDPFYDNSHGNGVSDSCTGVSFGCLTCRMDRTDHTAYFSLDVVCKDFEPYPGDRIQVAFSVQPGTQSRKAISVKPMRHKHVHKAYITSLHGRCGVIDGSVFFTLDSLKLPNGYTPKISDIVDVVAVESFQSRYTWRAISMTPVKK